MQSTFAEILRQPGEELTPQQAMLLSTCWFDAAVDYTRSEGSMDRILALCGSPGEFMMGADRLCCWLLKNRYDAYPLWDAAIAVEGAMDAEGRVDFKAVNRLVDRAMLVMRATQIEAGNCEAIAPLPRRRLSRNDDRDRWMIDQAAAGLTHGEISELLSSQHPEWEQIESTQGVSRALKRYREKLGSE